MLARIAPWYRSCFGHAIVAAALLWTALPPCNLWPLAWVAPVWWVLLIRRSGLKGEQPRPAAFSPTSGRRALRPIVAVVAFLRWLLDGDHPYRGIYLAGFLFWCAALHWLCLPYWATGFLGLLAAFYMGFYLPVFVGLCRVAVHRMGVSVIVAAPVVWAGLEFARAHLITGTTLAALSHTQFRWIRLIQVADLFGAYGVGFVVMLGAACVARMVPCDGRRWAVWPLAPAVAVLTVTLLYGQYRITEVAPPQQPAVRVALIQGCIDSTFKADQAMAKTIHREYHGLSREAVNEFGRLDVIIWPETICRYFWITLEPGARMPGCSEVKSRALAEEHRRCIAGMAHDLATPMILGLDALHFGSEGHQQFNAAILISPDGTSQGPYHKQHLVLFGEYVPLARHLPWLYELTPLSDGVTPGESPVTVQVANLRFAPNICYESVLPHVIRSQVCALKDRGEEPDVLVNLTNDGWFYGSAELDMHLICGAFRAIECRKPLLIAANTGFSAHITSNGKVVSRGRRHATDKILAEVHSDGRQSAYLRLGDWPVSFCLGACLLLAAVGFRSRGALQTPARP